MRLWKPVLVGALLAICLDGSLRGSMPAVPTGHWAATGNMVHARSGASSVLLPNGAVLVTGGADASGAASADAELFEPSGQFIAAGDMSAPRANHASVLLADGRVLVIGGRNSDGAIGSTDIYDHGEWHTAAPLGEARWGHTATLLDDGRVLVAGGENETGPVASVETFDPTTGDFALVGTLASPRKGHASARLADGRVLIAGGFDGDAALASIDVFDPASNSVTSFPSSLNTARAGLSATTLLDGEVLFFGGYDGTRILNSADVLDPVTGAVRTVSVSSESTGYRPVARRDHQAFLLPNNNAVLLVGGVSESLASGSWTSAETPSADLYVPWTDQFTSTNPTGASHRHATGSTLSSGSYGLLSPGDGLLMLAGGDGLASSEIYAFATVKTDKDDYSPGTVVTITGTGWQPGEEVTLTLDEVPQVHEPQVLKATADEFGNIANSDWAPESHHIGVRFHLMARGSGSQARTAFSDSVSVHSITVAAQAPAAIQSGAAATYNPVTVGFNGGGSCVADLTVTGLPTGASASWSTNPISSTGADVLTILTINTTGSGPPDLRTPQGTSTFTVKATTRPVQGNCTAGNQTATATLVVDNTSPAVTINQAAGQLDPTNASPINFAVVFSEPVSDFASADVTLSGTAGATTVVITGGPTTYNAAVSGMSTTGTVIASIAAGGAHDAAGNANVASTSTDNTVTFNSCTAASVTSHPASQTVTYGVASASFSAASSGTPSPTVQWQVSTTGGASWTNLGGATSTTLTIANPTVSLSGNQYRAVFTNSCGGTQTATTNAATLTVNAKQVTITPNAGQNKVYGGADPTLTYMHSALGGTDTDSVFTGALGRAAGENVGTYAIDLGTLSAGGNYQLLLAATPVTFAITAKPLTVTPDAGQHKVYGDADPTLTYAHTTLGGTDTDSVFTGALGRAAGENVGTYAIDLGTLSAGSNYQLLLAATPVTFAITPKPVTVTPDAGQHKVYGDADPTLTYAHTALGGTDPDSVFTGALGRAAGENVGTYAINLGTLSAGSNYQLLLAATPVTFAITPKPVTVTPDAGQHKVYGDAGPTLTYTLGESIAVTGALGRAAGENVGTYSIDLGTLCSTSANYMLVLSAAPVTFAITPKTVIITPASGQHKVYGSVDPALTYAHTALGGSDTDSVFTGALARAAGENVGPYVINLNTLSAGGNYILVLSATPVAFEIAPAPLTIVVTAAPMTYTGSAYAGATCAALGVNGEHPASTLSYEDASHSALPAAPINAGDYFARCAAGGAGTNYLANASTAAFTIAKATQSIAFTSTPPNPFILGTTYVVSATGGGSGNPVTFSSLTPAICSVSGSTVTAITVGQCQVAANQLGNGNYLAAPQSVQAFGTHYNFAGFFRPVDNLPVLNVAKAGSGIPVKFSLNGNFGLSILASGYPLSGPVACSATEVGDIVDETVNAGGSSLTYDSLTDQYIYVWKTQKSWAGSCRILVVRLSDGTDKIAKFEFTK